MGKALLLYALSLSAIALGTWQPSLAWLTPVAAYALLPGGAIWLWRREGHPVRDLGFGRSETRLRELGRGLLIGFAAPLAFTLLLAVAGGAAFAEDVWAVPLLAGILAGVIAGIVKNAITVFLEEFVFRGFFIQRLRLELGLTRAAVLASLLFALVHGPAMSRSGLSTASLLLGLLSWFGFGLALSLGFVRMGGSLWFPWGLHYAYNLLYSLTPFLVSAVSGVPTRLVYRGPTWWTGHPAWTPESGVAGLLLMLALLGAVWRIPSTRREG